MVRPQREPIDPACGTGGFLLAAHDYLVKKNPHLAGPEKIVEDLEAALEQFREIATDLGTKEP